MDLGIAGKRALVTAGSRGIGRACVVALAQAGAKVATCARGTEDLNALIAELARDGHEVETRSVDLMPPGNPSELAATLMREAGAIDIVVHNFGGTLGVTDPFSPAKDWHKVWRANFEVAVEVNNVVVPAMLERNWGRIVCVSSNAGIEHQASLPYSAAKAALTAYTRGMGRTLAASGVVMSAVLPGVVLTEGGQWEEASRRDPDYVSRFLKERVPRGCFGTPQEVAAVVSFLCSELAMACAGTLFQMDGGQGRSFFG